MLLWSTHDIIDFYIRNVILLEHFFLCIDAIHSQGLKLSEDCLDWGPYQQRKSHFPQCLGMLLACICTHSGLCRTPCDLASTFTFEQTPKRLNCFACHLQHLTPRYLPSIFTLCCPWYAASISWRIHRFLGNCPYLLLKVDLKINAAQLPLGKASSWLIVLHGPTLFGPFVSC